MPSPDELVPLADASAFIFTGSIARTGASTEPTHRVDPATVVVTIDDVIKAPAGMRGLARREVTVQLLHPLPAGEYVFFADPLAIGAGIALKELRHLDAKAKAEAASALERGYAELIRRRVESAFLVALGTTGPLRPLVTPAERYKGKGRPSAPWALAPLEIEHLLKGKGKPRRVTLVGPSGAYKRLPRTPALRAELRAILILHHPPDEALEHLPADDRQSAAYIADTADIQPPDRLETISRILKAE
jgi:hypothetical protein